MEFYKASEDSRAQGIITFCLGHFDPSSEIGALLFRESDEEDFCLSFLLGSSNRPD